MSDRKKTVLRDGNFVMKVVNGVGGLKRLRLSSVSDDWRVEWREDNPLFTTLPLICQNADAFKVICLAFYSMTGWLAPADALDKAIHILTDAAMQADVVIPDEDEEQAMVAAEMIEEAGKVDEGKEGGDG